MPNGKFLLIVFGLVFWLSSEVYAQSSGQIRRLPPSLERELKLRKGGKVRIIGFVDTLKAQNLIAQSIRDSSAEELDSNSVRDTAIIMIDSSVSLTDKEWLDSMLAELPEYRMTPQGVRFEYPAEILVETTRKTVPPDTTLTTKMDPVSKEDLPLYDALPIPLPLEQPAQAKNWIEVGLGLPYLPRIDFGSLLVSNSQTSLRADGTFRTTGADEPAIKQRYQLGLHGRFAFPREEYSATEIAPQLGIDLSSGAVTRSVLTHVGLTQHSMYLTTFGGDFTIGSTSQLQLAAHASYNILNDDTTATAGVAPSENRGNISVALEKSIGSSYSVKLYSQYTAATIMGGSGVTAAPEFLELQLLLQQKENTPFQWKIGLQYSAASDGGGSRQIAAPIIGLRYDVTHSIDVGASFEPRVQLVGLQELLQQNMFYSPTSITGNSALYSGDNRRVVTEPVNLLAYVNYFISHDDELHARFRITERNNEPTFYSDSTIGSHGVFIATPLDTRRIDLEIGGSLLLFQHDKLSASFLIRSATALQSEPHFNYAQALPFEPTALITASYSFGEWGNQLFPRIECTNIEHQNRSYTYLNCEASYNITKSFTLKGRIENIFGNPGDFWTGFDEYPRAFRISAKLLF